MRLIPGIQADRSEGFRRYGKAVLQRAEQLFEAALGGAHGLLHILGERQDVSGGGTQRH
jgi:hypothetical protein